MRKKEETEGEGYRDRGREQNAFGLVEKGTRQRNFIRFLVSYTAKKS